MAEDSISVLEAQVDWLTVTSTLKGMPYLLGSLGTRLCAIEHADGYRLNDWSWRGYDGQKCGSITWGTRTDGNILQLSGNRAQRFFDDAYPICSNVTRIDIQVTARCGPEANDYAVQAYELSSSYRPSHGAKPKTTHYRNDSGGSTFYLGSRVSEGYARLYNKWAESADERYKNCWRWEVECKGTLAQKVSFDLANSPSNSEWCAGFVWSWFADRGITPPWIANGVRVAAYLARGESDYDSNLEWLRKQVSGTVDRLVSAGLGVETINALGLDGFLDVTLLPWYSEGTGHHAE